MGKVTKTTEQFLQEVNLKWNNEFELCSEEDDTETKEYTGSRHRMSLKHKPCGTVVTKRADGFFEARCGYCRKYDPETKKAINKKHSETKAATGTKLNTTTFLQRVNEKWGDEFEYCGVDYTDARSPMSLLHKPCGTIITYLVAERFKVFRCTQCALADPAWKANKLEKTKQTNLARYGVKFAMQNQEIRERARAIDFKKREDKNYSPLTKKQLMFHEADSLPEAIKNLAEELGTKPTINQILEASGYLDVSRLYAIGLSKHSDLYKVGGNSSKAEEEIADFITKYSDYEIIRNSKKLLQNGQEIDIYLPELQIGIEYCGMYWHSSNPKAARGNPKPKNYHLEKLEAAEAAGIRLIQIFEWEWIMKRNIVCAKLASILKLNTPKIKVFARKCKIQELAPYVARDFANANHIQGYVNASVKLGLFYDEELVAMMTFVRNKDTTELSRYCTKLSHHVVGGASKLLKHALKNYDLPSVYTFSDNRWSSRVGNMYFELGFEYSHNSAPNYFYWRNSSSDSFEVWHRSSFQKSKLEKKLTSFDPDLTEFENVEAFSDFFRIHDAGNMKYVYTKDVAK